MDVAPAAKIRAINHSGNRFLGASLRRHNGDEGKNDRQERRHPTRDRIGHTFCAAPSATRCSARAAHRKKHGVPNRRPGARTAPSSMTYVASTDAGSTCSRCQGLRRPHSGCRARLPHVTVSGCQGTRGQGGVRVADLGRHPVVGYQTQCFGNGAGGDEKRVCAAGDIFQIQAQVARTDTRPEGETRHNMQKVRVRARLLQKPSRGFPRSPTPGPLYESPRKILPPAAARDGGVAFEKAIVLATVVRHRGVPWSEHESDASAVHAAVHWQS